MTDRTVDVDLIRQLAELLDQTSLTEIEVEDEGVRIRVARTAAPGVLPGAAITVKLVSADPVQRRLTFARLA